MTTPEQILSEPWVNSAVRVKAGTVPSSLSTDLVVCRHCEMPMLPRHMRCEPRSTLDIGEQERIVGLFADACQLGWSRSLQQMNGR